MKNNSFPLIFLLLMITLLGCSDASRWDIIGNQISGMNSNIQIATITSTPNPYLPPILPEPTVHAPVVNQEAVAEGKVRINYRCGEPLPVTNQLKIHLQIENRGNTGVNLNKLSLNYYYTKEGTSEEILDFDFISDKSITPKGKFHKDHLKLTFSGANKLLKISETFEIQLRIHKADWSDYDQSNDYSWNPKTKAYTPHPEVPLYEDARLHTGIEPWAYYDPDATPTPLPYHTPEAESSIILLYQCKNSAPADSEVMASIKIKNERFVDAKWKDMAIRYYFTLDEKPYIVLKLLSIPHPLSMHDVKLDVKQSGPTDYYIEFTFDTEEVITKRKTMPELYFSFNFYDMRPIDETDDFSFDPHKSGFKEHPFMSIHEKDTLIFGYVPK